MTCDADAMAADVLRHAKVAVQCERALPPNTVLPRLRALLQRFDAMVPVVVAMRNPALSGRGVEAGLSCGL